MKKSNIITQILPHICIILSVVTVTLLIAEMCNVSMEFMDNDFTRCILFILCFCSFFSSLILCGYQKHE